MTGPTWRVMVVGAGLVGTRVASMLAKSDDVDVLLVAQSRARPPLAGVTVTRGWPHSSAQEADIAVVATESSEQMAIATRALSQGTAVVCTADNPAVIDQLLSLDDMARSHGVPLVVGAAYSPGVSTLLAAHLVESFDKVSSIKTAQFGTGGPACAREHHRATSAPGREVYRGQLRPTRGGSGRELVWFPEPIGGADCYRAGLADPLLLHRAFPDVARIESRQAATRRDRLTARVPMLRPPHAEGLLGAVWAEVRGVSDGRTEHRSMAATAPQATGAAAMGAAAGRCLMESGSKAGRSTTADYARTGAQTPANLGSTQSILRHVSADIGLWTYDGTQIVTKSGVAPPLQAARKWPVSSK